MNLINTKNSIKEIFKKNLIRNVLKNNNSKESEVYNYNKSDNLTENLLLFQEKTVKDILIPRINLSAVKVDITQEELCKHIVNRPHTRTIVYQNNLDEVIGFIHIKDLIPILVEGKKIEIKKLLRSPIITPPSMKIITLLSKMKQAHTQIAIVIDEYGSTDGIVTIEDIIEEMFGPIYDEHDDKLKKDHYQFINKNTLLTSGFTEIEEIENILKVTLKEKNDHFETIGGFILAKMGYVPTKGSKIIYKDINFEVLDSTARAVKKVKITFS